MSMGTATQRGEAGALTSVFKGGRLTWLHGDPVGAWWDRTFRVLFESECETCPQISQDFGHLFPQLSKESPGLKDF